MKRSTLTMVGGLCFLFAGQIFGDIPKQINYQGIISGSTGNPLADSTVDVEFRIYNAAAGGNSVWAETLSVTTDNEGRFNVILGQVNPIEDTVFRETERFLSINVESSGEIIPRAKLTSVGYSNRVSTVDGAKGGIIFGNTRIQSDLTVSGNVGVGTASPADKLEVLNGKIRVSSQVSSAPVEFYPAMAGTPTYAGKIEGIGGSTNLSIMPVGNVGVGTASPTEKLDVDGSIAIRNNNALKIYSDGIGLVVTSALGAYGTFDFHKTGDLNASVRLGHSNFPVARSFTIMTGDGTGGAAERLTILPTGNVGIGTNNPSSTLEVAGDLEVSGNIIGSTPWTPFPFASGYEDYVDAHGEGYQRVQYRKIGDIVYLRGSAHKIDHSPIVGGDTLGTIPPGFRPPAFELYMSYGQAFQITPSGQVIFITGGDHARNLYEISYSTSP